MLTKQSSLDNILLAFHTECLSACHATGKCDEPIRPSLQEAILPVVKKLMVTPYSSALAKAFTSSMSYSVASFGPASVNTYIGDPHAGSWYKASSIPLKVYSGQSPPPWALSLLISATNSPASASSLTITGGASVSTTKTTTTTKVV